MSVCSLMVCREEGSEEVGVWERREVRPVGLRVKLRSPQ
jgi:hypothetical protein